MAAAAIVVAPPALRRCSTVGFVAAGEDESRDSQTATPATKATTMATASGAPQRFAAVT
jgi:hypothetical protein